MSDYLLKIGQTKLKYILKKGYQIQENQEKILATLLTADGTEIRDIAEKRKTTITVKFSQIDGQTLMNYSTLWNDDFTLEYWSKDSRIYKTAIFRVVNKPTNSIIYSPNEIYDEFTVTMESV